MTNNVCLCELQVYTQCYVALKQLFVFLWETFNMYNNS